MITSLFDGKPLSSRDLLFPGEKDVWREKFITIFHA